MRAYWPAGYMKDAEVLAWDDARRAGRVPLNYDVYVFQKLSNPELNRRLLNVGKQVWWDVCDPLWWFRPDEAREITDTVTGIVASSQRLASDFSEWSGKTCRVIADRLEPSHFPLRRQHCSVDPVRLIWFGVSVNRPVLFGALANLERLKANGHRFSLTVLDNQPELEAFRCDFPVNRMRWDLAKENETLAAHDIALLPPYPGPWGAVKSNNKQLTAWACGLPVNEGLNYGELQGLVATPSLRAAHAEAGARVLGDYWVEQSARDWEQLLSESAP